MSGIRRRQPREIGVVRPHRHRVQLSDEDEVELTKRAHAVGVEVPEYLVQRGLASDTSGPGLGEVLTALLKVIR